jgi:hypothetical protein
MRAMRTFSLRSLKHVSFWNNNVYVVPSVFELETFATLAGK